MRTDILHGKATRLESLANESGTGFVSIAWWIDSGNAHQVLRECHHFISLGFNACQDSLDLGAERFSGGF